MEDKIQPSKDEECCCCQTNNVLLYKFKHHISLSNSSEEIEHQHCEICYGTLIGNTCTYKRNYLETRDIAVWIASCTNIILKAINEKKDGL